MICHPNIDHRVVKRKLKRGRFAYYDNINYAKPNKQKFTVIKDAIKLMDWIDTLIDKLEEKQKDLDEAYDLIQMQSAQIYKKEQNDDTAS